MPLWEESLKVKVRLIFIENTLFIETSHFDNDSNYSLIFYNDFEYDKQKGIHLAISAKMFEETNIFKVNNITIKELIINEESSEFIIENKYKKKSKKRKHNNDIANIKRNNTNNIDNSIHTNQNIVKELSNIAEQLKLYESNIYSETYNNTSNTTTITNATNRTNLANFTHFSNELINLSNSIATTNEITDSSLEKQILLIKKLKRNLLKNLLGYNFIVDKYITKIKEKISNKTNKSKKNTSLYIFELSLSLIKDNLIIIILVLNIVIFFMLIIILKLFL